LYLVTSQHSHKPKGKISQNCKHSTSVGVSSGSAAVSSAVNESDVCPFPSASVPSGHDARLPLECDDALWDIPMPVSPLYSYIQNFDQLSGDCGGDDGNGSGWW
jgi:hypothetical protein